MRTAGLQTGETVIQRKHVCRWNATHTASSDLVKTVDRCSFGPIEASVRGVRCLHVATVFGFIPSVLPVRSCSLGSVVSRNAPALSYGSSCGGGAP